MNAVAARSVQFMPVGRERREWMWKARDESNTISISGQRFESLTEADARTREQVLAATTTRTARRLRLPSGGSAVDSATSSSAHPGSRPAIMIPAP